MKIASVTVAFAAFMAMGAAQQTSSAGNPNQQGTGQNTSSSSGQSNSQDQSSYDPNKKLKPEDDVTQIGKRDVGGGPDFYSQKSEDALGASLADQVVKESHVITDPVVNEYINRLAQNLVRNSDAKVPFTVKVLQDDTINAFALPGGYFFVNSGLILAADEEDELAGAMAHEIAHVCARHATRNATKGELLEIASIPAIIAAGPGLGGLGAREAANVAVPYQFMHFSRAAESEADWLGIQYMWKAGYDPNGMVRAFEIIEETEKEKPGLISRAFESHPQTPDRVETSEREIRTIIPPRPDYLITTSDFDAVKARLRAIIKSSIEQGVTVPSGPASSAAPPAATTTGPPVIKHP